jgi:hypothetical protein
MSMKRILIITLLCLFGIAWWLPSKSRDDHIQLPGETPWIDQAGISDEPIQLSGAKIYLPNIIN